jgi:PAS domain S-box-containing protein
MATAKDRGHLQARDASLNTAAPYLTHEQLTDFVENAAMPVHLVGPDGSILWANTAELKLLGYSAEEYIGHNIAEFHVDEPVITDILRRLTIGEELHECEARLRAKDGSLRYVCITSNVHWEDGRFVHTRCFTRDITQQKHAAELQQRLAAIVESSDDAIISKDLNGIIQSWNTGAERIFGYTAEEIIGKPITTLAVPERVDEIPNILGRIRRGERVDHYETKRRTKDGRVLSISLTVSPIRDASGTIIGASKIARDITPQRHAQEAQRALERELMLLIEASGTLLSSPHSEDVLRGIVEIAAKSIVADAYAVWRKQRSGGVWKLITSQGLSAGYERNAFENAASPGQAVPSQPFAVEDVEQFPLLQQRAAFYRAEGIRSMLGVPLTIHGEIGGTVVFYHRWPHDFTEAEIRLGAALGNIAAAAIGSAELYERQLELRSEAERAERQAAFLAEAGAVLSSSLDYETTLSRVAQAAVPTFADWCSVDVLDERGEVRRVAVAHEDPAKVQFAIAFRLKYPPREKDPMLTALRTGKSILVEEITEEMLLGGARSSEHLEDVRALGIRSFIVAPMLAHGRSVGTLTFVGAESRRRYSTTDLAFAEELARRAATAIEHARLHAEVRESESRFRELANAVPAFVWVAEPDGQVKYLNERWYDYTGQSTEDSLRSGWADVLHPEDADRVLGVANDARERQVEYAVECRYRRADGAYRWFLARAIPVRDAADRTLKWFGTSTDIHEAKETRETAQLLNRVGPVLAAELDLQKLTQSVTDIATRLTGAQFGALFHNVVNEQAESYMLYTLCGVEPESFSRFPMPRNTHVFAPTFRGEAVVRSNDITRDPRYGKNPPYHGMPEGHLPVRSYLAVPVVSRSGEVLAGLFFGHSEPAQFTEWHERTVTGIAAQAAIALDNARLFTEARAARESAERSNEELRRANADLEQFAFSASHDLKEPLRMVTIYSQMLERKYGKKLDPQAEEYFGYVINGAQRMNELVEDLLAYTQAAPPSHSEVVPPAETDRVLDNTLANLKRALDESGATIQRRPLPVLLIAEVHLTQLFQNVIENALKYRGDERPHITIEAARDGELWRISINDNGMGIAPQYAEQVFGIFKRLHTSDKYSGTGIGLAICQRIVHRYGGRIWVESKGEGKGSTFFFTLPGAEPISAAHRTEAPDCSRGGQHGRCAADP